MHFIYNNKLNSRNKLQEELIMKFQECGLQVLIHAILYWILTTNSE